MEKVFKVSSEAQGSVKQAIAQDAFARVEYKYQDAKIAGLDFEGYALYVDADDAFFKEHEKEVLVEGVEELKGDDLSKAVAVFKAADDNVAGGIALFD